MNSFSCDCCGICCQTIDGIKELRDFDLGNGVCKFLDQEEKKCSIYKDRPLVCRIDGMYEAYYAKIMTRERFYCLNHKACKILKNKQKE